MEQFDNIPDRDREGLRNFGLTIGIAFAVVFGLILPWLFETSYPVWPWAIAGILVVWGLVLPQSLRPVYRGWMKFGLLLNRVTSPLILGILFFALIYPIGLLRRLSGRDAIKKSMDSQQSSYRVSSTKKTSASLERPF